MGCSGHLVDRAREGELVRLGGPRKAAQLADELQRGRADLLVRGGRLEVVQGLDVSAHGIPPRRLRFGLEYLVIATIRAREPRSTRSPTRQGSRPRRAEIARGRCRVPGSA